MARSRSVAVVGQGQVGRALAEACHAAGFTVTGIDTDAAARQRANAAPYPVVGELPSGLFDVLILAVQTDLAEGIPDLGPLARAAAQLAPHVASGSIVINECTVYPGATEEVVRAALIDGGASGFHLVYSPERIDPGNAVWTIGNTPKLVAGDTAEALAAGLEFYSHFVSTLHPVSRIIEAEFAKLAENSFRALNIAFANELALTADALGVDIAAALDAAATKPFGYLDFRPGPGVGGHCIPIDPSYLSWRSQSTGSVAMPLLDAALDGNAAVPARVASRAITLLEGSATPTVLLLGLSHKRDVDDLRGAPSLEIAGLLRAAGVAVFAVDEVVDPSRVPASVTLLTADQVRAGHFDLAIHLTSHSSLDVASVLPDGTRALDPRRSLRGYAHVVR